MGLRFDPSSDDRGAGSVEVYLGQHSCVRGRPQDVVEQQPRVPSKVLVYEIRREHDEATAGKMGTGGGRGGQDDNVGSRGCDHLTKYSNPSTRIPGR